jgi:hypothetical protein
MFQVHHLTKVIGSLCFALTLLLSFTGLALAQGPTITTTDPITNEVGVALTHTISLTYSQAISPATVHTGTVVAQGMMGGLITGTYNVNGANATLTPSRPFFPNEIVRTTATSSTQNLSGDEATPYQWQFTAGKVISRCVAGFSDIDVELIGVRQSSVAWGDYDNDGDLDILLSGTDSLTSPRNPVTKVYRNDNNAFTDISADLTAVRASNVAWGDYDNDGDLDILLSGDSSDNFLFNEVANVYRNDNEVFTDINASLTGVRSGSVDWGDYDNDGDLDILLSGNGIENSSFISAAKVYRNDNEVFTDINASLTGVRLGSVDWGDYDNDGDLDILLSGSDSGSITVAEVYRNDGGAFTNINASLTGVYYSSVTWGDYDNDGDLDILLSGINFVTYPPTTVAKVYRNDGGVFTNTNASLIEVGHSSVAWGDYDNDGDLDILLSGLVGGNNPVTKVYRNDNEVFTDINAGLTGVSSGSVAWGDYDNDGDIDILLTGDSGINLVSKIYRNNDCPLAEAGPNQTVAISTLVTLDGSASTDPNGGALSYGWSQTGGPAASFTPNLSVTTFVPPTTPTVLTFSLTITTGEGYTATDSTVVTVTEISPYTLTVTTVGSGTVNLNPPGGVYTENTTVTLTAIPDSGWQFTGWTGDLSGGTASLPLLMDSHKAITATFNLLDNQQTIYLPLVVR